MFRSAEGLPALPGTFGVRRWKPRQSVRRKTPRPAVPGRGRHPSAGLNGMECVLGAVLAVSTGVPDAAADCLFA